MDTVARLGGDAFAVLLPRVDGVGGARGVAERLLAALHLAFPVEELLLAVEASVGLSVYPDLGANGGELLQQADLALYAAKEARGAVAVYQPPSTTARAWSASRCSPTFAGRSTPTSSRCTTSPRRTCGRTGSRGSRRWSAGATRSGECWHPTSSSPRRSRAA